MKKLIILMITIVMAIFLAGCLDFDSIEQKIEDRIVEQLMGHKIYESPEGHLSLIVNHIDEQQFQKILEFYQPAINEFKENIEQQYQDNDCPIDDCFPIDNIETAER